MLHFRDISITVASLVIDITSERISSAGQLGDWIFTAKNQIVSSAASNSSFLATYSFWRRRGMTTPLIAFRGCKITSGRARLSRLLVSKRK